MSDTPPPTPTDAKRTEALARMADIDQQLMEKDATGKYVVGVESQPHQRLRDEKIRLAAIAHAPKPTPAPTDDWRAAKAHRQELAEIRAERDRAPEGSPLREQLNRELVSATAEYSARTAAPELQHELIGVMPDAVRNEHWVPELIAVGEKHGVAINIPALLHTALHAASTGRTYSDDEAVAELVTRHGPEQAAEIEQAARALAQHLPKDFRNWLGAKRLYAHPDLIEHAASVWRRRGLSR